MQHKTRTTLGELRIGDSFTFASKAKLPRVDVWRVMDSNKKWVMVNQINAISKIPILRQNELKRKDTEVVFLRHTVPVPGEEIFIEDLKAGDVFRSDDFGGMEFTVVKENYPFYTVEDDKGQVAKAGNLLKVIFVKHAATNIVPAKD